MNTLCRSGWSLGGVMLERKEQLLEQIQYAFSEVERGDGISLHEASAMDDYASEAERQLARLKDADAHWTEVPDEHISQNHAVFSFLDIKGHRYYAPAFMSWLIRTGYDTSSNSAESAQFAFDPWGKVEGGHHYPPHEIFTPAQCKCIAQYLLYIYEQLDEKSCCSTAKEYFDAYWAKFL
jgi:hypothetical protein